ncbi:hypothetical protein [Frigoriflavimonas asaccharolytica]|uniref:Uncharacterized protein n=1 Tax=Frigoriflavimonas asaccharolytica TaxID=2735899 RepID=A0A8J8GAH5_9FLAO|nr:hypothetical protein [Frigoriflavimonas asaccharolytica]NRS94181.1 hypothetical protein [Frigoriflavimonas asaccharolytica]
MKKSLLLLLFMTIILCKAQSYEYEYSTSIKYNYSLKSYDNEKSYSRMKMVAKIDEFNKRIELIYYGESTGESASLNLNIVEKSDPDKTNSITYVCEGVKSNLIDQVVITKNDYGKTLIVMVKCKNGICPNGTFSFNK